MKLFLDANVIFTASYSSQGLSRGLFRLSAAGKCTLFTSAFTHEEAVRNIRLKAPDKSAGLATLMKQVEILPEPNFQGVVQVEQLPLAQKDAPVLAAAIQGNVDIFVTGDRRDFGHLYGQVVEGVKILSPSNAFEIISQSIP
jgi:predicted nucleic acid-binding protein